MMGNSSPHVRHRNHPLRISVEFCGLFDEESRTRVSSKLSLARAHQILQKGQFH